MVTFTSIILLIAGASLVTADIWTYKNKGDDWSGVCKTGKRQSPIDISGKETQEKSFTPFQSKNYDAEYESTMINNGHTVSIKLKNNESITIRGGSLPREYILDSVHFHWQSEHTIDGYRYPLEVHLVHYSSKYASIADALNDPEGLAVFGVLFDISVYDDEDFQPLIAVLENVDEELNTVVPLKHKISPSDFLPRDKGGFYRYLGSLTTPYCNEAVMWTVFTNSLRISEKQMAYFRKIQSSHGPLEKNYRGAQELHGRSVYVQHSPIRAIMSLGNVNIISSLLSTLTFVFILSKTYANLL